MLTNRYQFIEKLQAFIEAPTETEYCNIRKYLNGNISQSDYEAWLVQVKAATIFFTELPDKINKSNIGLLLLLSIANDLGIGVEQNIPLSAQILTLVIELIKKDMLAKEAKATESKTEKNYSPLLGFCYLLLGHRLADLQDLKRAINSYELAQINGYKMAFNSLGIHYCHVRRWDKAVHYFQLALQEANYFEALLKIGFIYIKYGKHITLLKGLNESDRIKIGMKKLREAHKKGINVEKEIMALYTLYSHSTELLYHAAIIAKDKSASQKLKQYIQKDVKNAAEILNIIKKHDDDPADVNKALANGHVDNLFLACTPKDLTELKLQPIDIKFVSCETILTEFKQKFEQRKLKDIEELRAHEGEIAESFILFLENFKNEDPRKLFNSKIILLEFKKGDFTKLIKTKKLNSSYLFADCIKRDVLTKIDVHETKKNILKSHKQEFIKQQLSSTKDSDSLSIDPQKTGILLQETSIIEKDEESLQNEIQKLKIKYLDSYAKASAEIKICEQALRTLEQEKKAFLEETLASEDKTPTWNQKKEATETADAKFEGRITKLKNKINSHQAMIREVQLNHLLLYVDNYSKAGLDIALDQNIPVLFIEKIEELSSLFFYYREKYLTARKNEYFACRENLHAQTLFKAIDELEKAKQTDQKEIEKPDSEKPKDNRL